MHDEKEGNLVPEQGLTKEQEASLQEKKNPQTGKTISVARHQSIFLGPLPPASELIKYNSAVPDAANRIIKMAENQQQMREKELIANIEKDKKGFWAGLYSLTLISGLAWYAMQKDNYWIAGVLIALIGFAYCFFPFAYSRLKGRRDK